MLIHKVYVTSEESGQTLSTKVVDKVCLSVVTSHLQYHSINIGLAKPPVKLHFRHNTRKLLVLFICLFCNFCICG